MLRQNKQPNDTNGLISNGKYKKGRKHNNKQKTKTNKNIKQTDKQTNKQTKQKERKKSTKDEMKKQNATHKIIRSPLKSGVDRFMCSREVSSCYSINGLLVVLLMLKIRGRFHKTS